ncbi:RNA polymerase sigma factor [Candidatus Laterigemmans baculatus]|uniref:RNA polymerase sigma factor n=1 Tax=Candidatus Laterigemmans baculatus TaxID=2770505 RepID=UPI0013D95797|nr:sigma-70 family RNA polymerase sigma factor [Candidatus Laterigemmans baculatus]
MGDAEADAVVRLIRDRGPALVLYAQQWCRTPEDVVQDAFLQLLRQADMPADPVAWLYRVVRNGSINAARTESRRGRRESLASESRPPWFEPAVDQRLDAEAAVEALEQLPIEQRESIVARLWGGLSYEQVAVLTGTSPATAYRRYVSGLETLREKMRIPCPAKTTT